MQIGDQVKFINENLSGIITRIINLTTIGVSVEDGFELPVLKKDVYLVQDNTNKNVEVKIPELFSNLHEGIFFIFEHSYHNYYKLLLLNNTQQSILVSYLQRDQHHCKGLYSGKIDHAQSQIINTLNLEEQSDWGHFIFSIIFHPLFTDKPRMPWYVEYQFRSKDFINETTYNQKKAFIIPLKPNKIEQLVFKNIEIEKPEIEKKDIIEIDRPHEIIDLHLEKLISNTEGILAHQALDMQLELFKNEFEKAISLNYSKITFVHGVGNGKLKEHIWRWIKGHPHLKTFKEAHKEKFGYGATEIEFK